MRNIEPLSNHFRLDTLPDQVFHRIKKMILAGELKGGDRIPEVKIAADFGVSRTPIREALRKLDEYGLITIKPRRYAEVLKMEASEVRELSLVRIQLEKLSVRLFIERATAEDQAAIRTLMAECRASGEAKDFGAFNEKDSQLHLELAKRSGNVFLALALEKLDAKVQLSRLVKPMNDKDIRSAIKEHEELISLLEKKSTAQAIEKLEQHILNNL